MLISEILTEDLRAWFGKGKKGGAGGGGWDRYNTKGERIGKCGDSKKGDLLDGKFRSKIEFIKEHNFSKMRM